VAKLPTSCQVLAATLTTAADVYLALIPFLLASLKIVPVPANVTVPVPFRINAICVPIGIVAPASFGKLTVKADEFSKTNTLSASEFVIFTGEVEVVTILARRFALSNKAVTIASARTNAVVELVNVD